MITLNLPPSVRKTGFSKLCLAAFVVFSFLSELAPGQGADAYKWSVQYLIDQSQPVFGRSQWLFPRHSRGLAISPDGRFLYAGYNSSVADPMAPKSSALIGEIRKIRLGVPDYEQATLRLLVGPRGKSIAVDDEGRVYSANGSSITIYDADLLRKQYEIATDGCEGVAVTREGGKLVLYGSERMNGILDRWVLQKTGKTISDATPDGFDGTGQLTIPGAKSLRGVAIDGRGWIWVADIEAGKIFRVEKGGGKIDSVDVKSPVALAFDGEKCFVTQFLEREITIIDDNLTVVGTLSVPWEELELSATGNNRTGALAGIAIVPGGKGFYVANEGGQTANQKSTYGRRDKFTDFVNGKIYMDSKNDDNEPILHAVPVLAAP
jgi:DNA-binding beta-propeller fold protein YncE